MLSQPMLQWPKDLSSHFIVLKASTILVCHILQFILMNSLWFCNFCYQPRIHWNVNVHRLRFHKRCIYSFTQLQCALDCSSHRQKEGLPWLYWNRVSIADVAVSEKECIDQGWKVLTLHTVAEHYKQCWYALPQQDGPELIFNFALSLHGSHQFPHATREGSLTLHWLVITEKSLEGFY